MGKKRYRSLMFSSDSRRSIEAAIEMAHRDGDVFVVKGARNRIGNGTLDVAVNYYVEYPVESEIRHADAINAIDIIGVDGFDFNTERTPKFEAEKSKCVGQLEEILKMSDRLREIASYED